MAGPALMEGMSFEGIVSVTTGKPFRDAVTRGDIGGAFAFSTVMGWAALLWEPCLPLE